MKKSSFICLACMLAFITVDTAAASLGRSDREALDILKRWRDNPANAKDSVLAQNAVAQVTKAEQDCQDVSTQDKLNVCRQDINAATRMYDTLAKTDETLRKTATELVETQQADINAGKNIQSPLEKGQSPQQLVKSQQQKNVSAAKKEAQENKFEPPSSRTPLATPSKKTFVKRFAGFVNKEK